ncbi:MAG: TolC family protein [Tepidisphaeraceae bacterium]
MQNVTRRLFGLLLAGLALVGAGCQGWFQPKPDPKQLEAVNEMVGERTQSLLDIGKLLQAEPSEAVAGPTGTLTCNEAVQRALEHNLTLMASVETLPIAQANLVQAGLFPNPNFGQTGASYFPLSGQGGVVATDFLFTETLNGFFAAPFKTQIARAQKYQAGIDIANQAFGLAQQTRLQFDRLASLVRERRIEERIAEVYRRAADDAKATVGTAAVTAVDVDRAMVQYKDAQRRARREQIEYAGAATQMNWLMGVQSAVQWELPESVKDPPPVVRLLPTSQALEEMALKYRMDLIRASFDHQIAKGTVMLARLGTYPQTTIGFDAKRDSVKNWTGGPTFASGLQFFDPGIVGYWIAEYGLIQTERTYEALKGQVRQDVRNALSTLQAAEEDMRFYQSMVPEEKEIVRRQELSFRQGNARFEDLLNTLQEYSEMLRSYECAIQAYQEAEVGLETAVGLSWERIEEKMRG